MLLIKTCPWWHYSPLTLDSGDWELFSWEPESISYVWSLMSALHRKRWLFCPYVFDLCSSNCWRRLCGLSLFSSSWSPWGWITHLTNNMNVSMLHSCVLFNLWKEVKAFLEAMRLCCVHTMQHLSCFVTLNWHRKTKWLPRVARKTALPFNKCILIALHNLNTQCTQGWKCTFCLIADSLWRNVIWSDVSSHW